MGTKRRRTSPDSTNRLSEGVTVTRGDHLFALYATDRERRALAVPFLIDGLREGSICFLVAPEISREEILTELKESRTEIDNDIAAGRLIATEHQDSPREQYEFLERETSAAERDGATTFRLFADMIGARQRMSLVQLLELEEGFDEAIVRNHQIAAMCAYDVRKFSGIELLGALKSHRGSVRYA